MRWELGDKIIIFTGLFQLELVLIIGKITTPYYCNINQVTTNNVSAVQMR